MKRVAALAITLALGACSSAALTTSSDGDAKGRSVAAPGIDPPPASTSSTPSASSTAPLADASGDEDVVTDAGAHANMVPDGVTKIFLKVHDEGFYPWSPSGSTCSPWDEGTFTIVLPSRELSWKYCASTQAGLYDIREGQRVLTPAEYAVLDDLMHAFEPSNNELLAADGADVWITFTTPSGETTYRDDFYGFRAEPGEVLVDGLAEMLTPLRQYAR